MGLGKIPKHVWWGVVVPIVVVALASWRIPPMIEKYREKPQRMATGGLKTIAVANADFRANDRDGNRIHDFWTADVAGLYQGGLKLIMPEVARADAAPLKPMPSPRPWHGYTFVALKAYTDWGKVIPYNQNTDTSGSRVRNMSRFGFCAYPDEYGWRCTYTYIINEAYTLYRIDNGGQPITNWPTDLELQEKWEKVD